MKNIAQLALLLGLISATPRAFPSTHANTCTTCYIDYENGNDSWSGTAETFQGGTTGPWKHAPGMLGLLPNGSSSGDGCAANCASQMPVAGDKYILKGGVVWPSTTLPWSFSWSGTSSTQRYGCGGPGCIYVGNAVGAGLQSWNKGIVNSVTLTRDLGGWNPASPPTVSLSGGGGSGAAATPQVVPSSNTDPNVAGFIYHISVTNQGSGYTSAPSCAISGSGGAGATCVADIDRPVMDLGGTQASPADWSIQSGAPNAVPSCPAAGSYTIIYGIECRNLMAVASTSSFMVPGIMGGSSHSTTTHAYLHGFFVDCAYPFGAAIAGPSCPAALTTITTGAISIYYPYDEASFNTIENGDSFFVATAASVANNVGPSVGAPNEMGSWGIQMGTEEAHGPESVHNNVIYGGAWQIRFVGNAQAGSQDPFLNYANETWLTMYTVNPSAHVNRQYSQLNAPNVGGGGAANLLAYNDIDHNHVQGSGNQQQCQPGQRYYFFNDVMWGFGTSTPAWGINTLSPATGGCTVYIVNDTIYSPAASGNLCVNSNASATDATMIIVQNLHCVAAADPDPFWSGGTNIAFENSAGSSVMAKVEAASTAQSLSMASGEGYSVTNLYAPTGSAGGTVTFANGTGSANLASLCSGYLVPLCSDINGNPRPASGPQGWQSGAYIYGSGGNSPIAPPTNLTAVVQ